MAYNKTEWKARQAANPNKFTKSQETANSVVLVNTPDSITVPGTLFTPENMNHIEEGIFQAHSGIAAEAQARGAAINAEAQARQGAINSAAQALWSELNNEAQARTAGDQHLQNQIEALMPEGLENLPELIAGVPEELEKVRTELALKPNNTDVVKRSEMGAAGGVATLGPKGTVPAAQLPALNSAVITLTADGQAAVLASLYGGTWKMIRGRTLDVEDGSSYGQTGSAPCSLSLNITAAAGAMVTVTFCTSYDPNNTMLYVSLISNKRGTLQTISLGSVIGGAQTFSSVVLQDGEVLSLNVVSGTIAQTYTMWTKSYNEYIYVRI